MLGCRMWGRQVRSETLPGAERRTWAPAAAVFSLFASMAILASMGWGESGWSIVVVGLYLTFSAALVFGLGWAFRLHWVIAAVAALGASPLLVWHVRETVRHPDLKSQVPLACLGVAAGLLYVGSLCRRVPLRRLGALATVSSICFVVLLVLSYTLSPSLRWQLLQATHGLRFSGAPGARAGGQ